MNKRSSGDRFRAAKAAGEARTGWNERGGTLQIILGVIGGVVLLCVLVALVAVWAVSHFVRIEVDDTPGSKRVEINTPLGGIKVEQARDVAESLKLPVYPEAWPDEESASVRLWGSLGDEEGRLDIKVAKFNTTDEFDKVDAFYREKLSSDYKREEGDFEINLGRHGRAKSSIHGNGVVYKWEGDGRVRGVAIERKWSRVEIGLFEIREGQVQ